MKLRTWIIALTVLFLMGIAYNIAEATELRTELRLTAIFTTVSAKKATYVYPDPLDDMLKCLDKAMDIQIQLENVGATTFVLGCELIEVIH